VQHGFTLIETLVVMGIVAVLAALAGPSFTPMIERWRVRDATESIQSSSSVRLKVEQIQLVSGG
jgi:type IV fimbrial biogenesis protein FimT